MQASSQFSPFPFNLGFIGEMNSCIDIQWTPSIMWPSLNGTGKSVLIREVTSFQRFKFNKNV